MNLKSLLLCSDEKIVRVLRRTLGDLDISVEPCASAEIALRHLTRGRFEAIIVDCAGPGAADVLGVVRTSPCNQRAVAVAILDPDTGLRSAFELGANFILYKPVTAERAKSSFRAARALMKKERRRNTRVPVQIAGGDVEPRIGGPVQGEHHGLRRGWPRGQLAPAQQTSGPVGTEVHAAGFRDGSGGEMRSLPGKGAGPRWGCVFRISLRPWCSSCGNGWTGILLRWKRTTRRCGASLWI